MFGVPAAHLTLVHRAYSIVPTVNLELRENIELVWRPSNPPFGFGAIQVAFDAARLQDTVPSSGSAAAVRLTVMPTLDEVYRRFGEVSEAAQIVETDLGTMLLFFGAADEGIIKPTLEVASERAADLMGRIDRQTFGQLLRNAKRHADALEQLEPLLSKALEERNRLAHSFYRQHNFRRNSRVERL